MGKTTKKAVKRTVRTSTSKKKAKRAEKLFSSKDKVKVVKKLFSLKKKAKKAVKSTVRTPIVKKVKSPKKSTPLRLKRSGKKSKSPKVKKKPVKSNQKRALKKDKYSVSSNSPAKSSSEYSQRDTSVKTIQNELSTELRNPSKRVATKKKEKTKILSGSPSKQIRKRAISLPKSPKKRSAKTPKKRSAKSPKKRSAKRKRSASKATNGSKKRKVSNSKVCNKSLNVIEEELEVEKICDIQFRNGQDKCLVKWKGFGMKHNTWEPLQNLGNASEAINEFYDEQVYEVEHICGVRSVGGKSEYYVKWKGWTSSSNSWEPRENLLEGARQEVMKFEKIRRKRTA